MSAILSSTHAPWVLVAVGPYELLHNHLTSREANGMLLVSLEGELMRSVDGLYDEIFRKMNFPDYCGRNLNALDECLNDLEWLDVGSGIIIVIRDANQMLRDRPEVLEGLVEILTRSGEEWATPVQNESAWDRPAVPFHSIFHYESSDICVAELDSLPGYDLRR